MKASTFHHHHHRHRHPNSNTNTNINSDNNNFNPTNNLSSSFNDSFNNNSFPNTTTNINIIHRIPLRKWIESEAKKQISAGAIADPIERQHQKYVLLRKTTIAYGITELLRHGRDNDSSHMNNIGNPSSVAIGSRNSGSGGSSNNSLVVGRSRMGMLMREEFCIDNFVVRVSCDSTASSALTAVGVGAGVDHNTNMVENNNNNPSSRRTSWKDIKGVDMISPQLSVDIVEPSFLFNDFVGFYDDNEESGSLGTNDNDDGYGGGELTMGRYLEVEFPTSSSYHYQYHHHHNEAATAVMASSLSSTNTTTTTAAAVSQIEEDARCHLLGALLYEVFSHLSPYPAESLCGGGGVSGSGTTRSRGVGLGVGPPRKKSRLFDVVEATTRDQEPTTPPPYAAWQKTPYFPLIDLGFPSSICLLVQNLLECGTNGMDNESYESSSSIKNDTASTTRPDNAYDSLDTVSKDLHLLLLDPKRFLFDQEVPPTSSSTSVEHSAGSGSGTTGRGMINNNGKVGKKNPSSLLFRKHKLYGRENEVSQITDAFCRVSTGKSEAFFIGGFSGSGKSRLVNSLTARVDMAEGYVLTHKFDQMSKEVRPLLEVISVFNDLCLLIKEKSCVGDLEVTVQKLMEVFGNDFSVLARLLPNIQTISPRLDQLLTDYNNAATTKESNGISAAKSAKAKSMGGGVDGDGAGSQMNLRSVCFTLQRFMRVVSSKSHPVMLFLDDLQWCDDSALSVIEGILCDVSGSSCLFFVGSYRSNEVREDHAIFPLINGLRSSGVPTTNLKLEGLTPLDLNTMISDAICMFPRICGPLSDIVFQKTKGNPFFVLEFLRSLVDGGLLEYSIPKRRWVWDEDRIAAMEITGNVLHLLSLKMSGLLENAQLALKVAACFGIKMKESVVGYLSTNSEYSNLRSGLEHVVAEGFMIKDGTSDFKFVHDKVREAAYSLIPDSEKNQGHYRLGMTLYSMTKGSNVEDIIFSIVDQVAHGTDDSLVQSPELKLDLAALYEMAGVKAVDCSDYVTARSYLNTALSLLPPNQWKTHYDRSLQLSFLFAKSSYSCGDVEKAQGILQEILGECRCIKDKLPAYFLLVTILYSCGEGDDAYTTCHDVLSQLGEIIPESLHPKKKANIIEATSKSIKNTSETDLFEMKEMDEELAISIKFYSLMATVAFFARPGMFAFITCRMVSLTMKHGICKYSLLGFIQYAMVCVRKTEKEAESASRIGNIAISCLKKRYDVAELLPRVLLGYYGFVAFNTDTLQTCAAMLGQGFDAGMSTGESGTAFLCSAQHMKTSLHTGEKLPSVLDKVDYYLELAILYKNELTSGYLGIMRDTISTLIDKGETTSSKGNSNSESGKKPANISESMYFHRAIRAFWLGHSERCHHCIGKVLQLNSGIGSLSKTILIFIHGLNSFQLLKRQDTSKLRTIPKNAISALKTAMSLSRWNFRNKVHLLEAENFSYQGNHEEAKASYAAAITSARSSRFVHEQGLACELAGFHYKKIGDHKSAWSFFNQAKQCYAEWGSQMKVASISRQLETFQITLSSGNVLSC